MLGVWKKSNNQLTKVVYKLYYSQHSIANIKTIFKSDCKVSKFHIEDRPTEFEKLTDGQEVSVEGANLK
jgi:hypothetical protein